MASQIQAIDTIEHGLLLPQDKNEYTRQKMTLGERMAYYKVPGFSIALVDQCELAWAKGYGVMEVGKTDQVTADTIFQAASISKPVSAMVALHLVEAGLLNLDGDVNDELRSWKIPSSKFTRLRSDGTQPRVTLRGLLSHNAGINIRGYRGYPSGRQLPSLLQILNGETPANSKPVRVTQTPGKAFRYSGGGYVIMQQVVEDVTGKSLVELVQDLILDKLGMSNSSFNHILPEIFLSKAATAHRKIGKPVPGKWHIYPENAPASL
jgi:CubicO group peptidase (beta-lactamase class C family)